MTCLRARLWRQYTHWTFPSDSDLSGSYMMARRLERKSPKPSAARPSVRMGLRCEWGKVRKEWTGEEVRKGKP